MVRQAHQNKDNTFKAGIKRFIGWNRSFGFSDSNWAGQFNLLFTIDNGSTLLTTGLQLGN
jgi:hypothetical protein